VHQAFVFAFDSLLVQSAYKMHHTCAYLAVFQLVSAMPGAVRFVALGGKWE